MSKYKNNKNFWNYFYKKNIKFKNSNFSQFVKKYINIKNSSLLDIGCGNGRDTFFFSKLVKSVYGIDLSKTAIENNNNIKKKLKVHNTKFLNKNFIKNKIFTSKKFNYIYARFFLHTINKEGEEKFFLKVKKLIKKNGLIFLEFRTIKDKTFQKGKKISEDEAIYGHYRRFINCIILKEKLKKFNLKILYFKESDKFSVYKNQKPHLARMILKS